VFEQTPSNIPVIKRNTQSLELNFVSMPFVQFLFV